MHLGRSNLRWADQAPGVVRDLIALEAAQLDSTITDNARLGLAQIRLEPKPSDSL